MLVLVTLCTVEHYSFCTVQQNNLTVKNYQFTESDIHLVYFTLDWGIVIKSSVYDSKFNVIQMCLTAIAA